MQSFGMPSKSSVLARLADLPQQISFIRARMEAKPASASEPQSPDSLRAELGALIQVTRDHFWL